MEEEMGEEGREKGHKIVALLFPSKKVIAFQIIWWAFIVAVIILVLRWGMSSPSLEALISVDIGIGVATIGIMASMLVSIFVALTNSISRIESSISRAESGISSVETVLVRIETLLRER
jgi:hypothetical protein